MPRFTETYFCISNKTLRLYGTCGTQKDVPWNDTPLA
jgi:hypothetical protein